MSEVPANNDGWSKRHYMVASMAYKFFTMTQDRLDNDIS